MIRFSGFNCAYVVDGRLKEVRSGDLSEFSNEDLRLEFTLQEDADARIYSVDVFPKRPLTWQRFAIGAAAEYRDSPGVFCNGFQSWTETKVFGMEDRMKPASKLIKGVAYAFGDYAFFDYSREPGRLHSWTYTYIKRDKNRVELLASLDDTYGYTVFEHDTSNGKLDIRKDLEGKLQQENSCLLRLLHIEAPEKQAFEVMASAKGSPAIPAEPALGWTSWYYYYTGITEAIILDNLEQFHSRKIPIDIFQIDDGYQQAVGDWLNCNAKFPNGMRPIAERIKACGYTPGIWLAPLAAERKSFIVREKPHWLLKDASGKPVVIGYNPLWSGKFYALDVYNEEVRDYLRRVFDTVLRDWGFDLVKLDFLYGTASIPQHGKSRGEVMRDAMQFLRECVGEKKILGCGVPLAAAEGLTEYCRIGPDIHLNWDFRPLKWLGARERPSTYNAVHNTVSRRHLSGRWFWNDPDVLLLRKNKNLLSPAEQYTLLLANMLFGHVLFTSDHIGEYDEATRGLFTSLFPLRQPEDMLVQQDGDFYRVSFRIGNNYYLALLNLSDELRMYKLPKGWYYDNRAKEWITGGKMTEIPKHSARLLLQVGVTPFALAGTSGHFFAGSEIKNIFLSGNRLEVEWDESVLNPVTGWFRVPSGYKVESVNGSPEFRRTEMKEFSLIEFRS